jgi:hypothetical protein
MSRTQLNRLVPPDIYWLLMVTLAGLEPATSPAPVNKDALPLELQRRHDLYNRLWRHMGVGRRTVQRTLPRRFPMREGRSSFLD